MGAYTYWIDAEDRVLRVNDAWLAFARANGAADLTTEAVTGQPLWRFVDGAAARELYRMILRRVRAHDVPILLPFRCDSPDRRRWMRLVISPLRHGELRLDGTLVREEARPPAPLLEAEERSGAPLDICSVCKRVFVERDEEWLEVEDASVRLELLEARNVPPLHQVVCTDCRSAMELLAEPDVGR